MKKTFISYLLIIVLALSLSNSTFAHPGRLDGSGGHNDNKNASGLGSYHFHCGDNPPHLHTNGVCPYKTSAPQPNTTPVTPAQPVASVKPTTPDISSEPKTGDVLGNVLYTDVTAYINGYEIPSYNIDGNTMIVAEDLANYGFDVTWNGVNFTLKIEFNNGKTIKPLTIEKQVGVVGSVRFNYVYTTVKTYVADKEVKGYNINGKTIIQFDELSVYGKITWDGTAREIRFN